MCQESSKESIVYFILISKNFVVVLISSNKHFFDCYYDKIENPPHHFVWTIHVKYVQNALADFNYFLLKKVNRFLNKVINLMVCL